MIEPTDLAQLTADGLLPIREVARITGVNAVTLRAWERRYGLIVPLRTAKGHRLYDDTHIERIRDIVTWLNRGVAVSQIRTLLGTSTPPELPQQNQWSALLDELLQAIDRFSERQLDDAFNRAVALYPPRTLSSTCCSRCSKPWSDAGRASTAHRWSACCSTPGCAASWAAASISTIASRQAARCCWSISTRTVSRPASG